MATKNINLGAILGAAATFADADLGVITINGKTLTELGGVISADKASITVTGYGVFTKTAAATASFTADAALTGDFTLVDGGVVKFTVADLSAATGAVTLTGSASTGTITGGAGNDSITTAAAATVVGGAGNDTITAGAFNATVTGGAGADKFVQTTAANTLKIEDYDYSQGDTITLKNTFAVTNALSNAGAFTDGTGTPVTATVANGSDNVYKVKVTDGSGTPVTKEFWTAKTTTGTTTIDGSAVTNGMVIDASSATRSVVQGGTGNDVINLGANSATLKVTKTAGNDTIAGFTEGVSGDVLNLVGATLSDVTFGANTTVGASTLTGLGITGTDIVLVKEDNGSIKKVGAAIATATDITVAGADVYVGFNDNTTNLDISAEASGNVVNLLDTNKYKNIVGVKGSTGGGVYIGTADTLTGTVIDLSAATAASEAWGGSKAVDTITLKVNTVKDTVWFGKTDGSDKVANFEQGFADAKDVINLYDVADVTNLNIAGTTTKVSVTAAAGNVLEVTGAAIAGAVNSVNLKLKDSAGNVKKVAAAVSDANATFAIDSANTADVVLGKAGKVNGILMTGSTNQVVNLLDTGIYKNINHVNLTGNTAAYNVVIGSADTVTASNITLAGSVTDAWGGSKGANLITTGAGKDTIWFGTNDGSDTIAGFTQLNQDKIKFYDKAVSELNTAYTWDGATSVLTSKANSDDKLTITGITGIVDILDKNDTATKVALATGVGAIAYDKDVKVYLGDDTAATTLTVSSMDNVVLYLDNKASNPVNDIYFSNITNINAAASTGQTVLIGNASTANTLTAGSTSSAMWGGGVSADTMVGSGTGVDEYWFGSGDGLDAVTAGVDSADKVVLHNLSVNDVTMTKNAGSFVVTAKDGSTLTVTDAGLVALNGGLTFQFGVNSAAQNYTYDTTNNKFVAKA